MRVHDSDNLDWTVKFRSFLAHTVLSCAQALEK